MGKLTTLRPRVPCLATDIAKPLAAASGRAGSARPGTTARGYGWQWQQLRLRILQRDGYRCQACKAAGRITAAREVDHKVNKAAGGSDDPDNLQSLCTDCHKAKTAAEAVGQG